MPQSYNVTLYHSTGFNTGNIPSSPNVLAQAPTYTQVDAVFERQNRNNGTIRIRANWNDIKDVDYMKLGEGGDATYFVVTDVSSLSDGTIELIIVQDDFNTAGGIDGVNVKGGWAERVHVGKDEDGLFENLLPEPWAPSERLVMRSKDVVHNEKSEQVKVAAATCNINEAPMMKAQLAKAVDSITGEVIENSNVVWPVIPGAPLIPNSSGTSFEYMKGTEVVLSKQSTSSTTNNFLLPGVFLFNVNNDKTREFINIMRSLGIENAITAFYTIPSADVITTETDTSIITKFQGVQHTYSPDQPYVYSDVKNAKTIALYNQYTVASMASGNIVDYEAKSLYAGGKSPDWDCIIDPSPTGTAYLQPTYYDGTATQPFEQAVTGSPWLNAGFTYNTSSGSAIVLANAEINNRKINMGLDFDTNAYNTNTEWARRLTELGIKQNAANLKYDMIGTGTQTLAKGLSILANGGFGEDVNLSDYMEFGGGILNMVRGAHNASFNEQNMIGKYGLSTSILSNNYNKNVAMSNYQMGENIFGSRINANLTTPELAFPISVNNAAYFGNAFIVTHITLGDNDVQRFDKFLTMFGYAVDKPFKDVDMRNRTYFNYVKTRDSIVTSDYASLQMCNNISNMFDSGVRLWHVLPYTNAEKAYDDNPPRA